MRELALGDDDDAIASNGRKEGPDVRELALGDNDDAMRKDWMPSPLRVTAARKALRCASSRSGITMTQCVRTGCLRHYE